MERAYNRYMIFSWQSLHKTISCWVFFLFVCLFVCFVSLLYFIDGFWEEEGGGGVQPGSESSQTYPQTICNYKTNLTLVYSDSTKQMLWAHTMTNPCHL